MRLRRSVSHSSGGASILYERDVQSVFQQPQSLLRQETRADVVN